MRRGDLENLRAGAAIGVGDSFDFQSGNRGLSAFAGNSGKSEMSSIRPTIFSFSFGRSSAGIQYSWGSELPTTWTWQCRRNRVRTKRKTYPLKPEPWSFAFQSRAICVVYCPLSTGKETVGAAGGEKIS